MLMSPGTNAPVVDSTLARGTGVLAWEVDFVVTSRCVLCPRLRRGRFQCRFHCRFH